MPTIVINGQAVDIIDVLPSNTDLLREVFALDRVELGNIVVIAAGEDLDVFDSWIDDLTVDDGDAQFIA